MAADRHLIAGREHDRADGVVVLQTGHPRGGVAWSSVRTGECQLVVAAVEGRSSREVRQAVSEDDRRAQRHDRQRGSEQCGADRERGGAASTFQGMTDPDHCARRRARGNHFRHNGRWALCDVRSSAMRSREARRPARSPGAPPRPAWQGLPEGGSSDRRKDRSKALPAAPHRPASKGTAQTRR